MAKFPEEVFPETINLIQPNRSLWKFLQNSGKRITRSMHEHYRFVCRNSKQAIRNDRTAKLEREAVELAEAFKQDTLKGYSLLKRQHRTRSKAVLPPEADFTEHYRSHYELGTETPLCVAGCEIPNSELDDTLSRGDFDNRCTYSKI